MSRCASKRNTSSFRVNAFQQQRGAAAVFRVITLQVTTLQKLGAPLVTGPTGSGKSTTLAAMIDHLNHRHFAHILTIEDPIEFVHNSKKCLVNQREVHAVGPA